MWCKSVPLFFAHEAAIIRRVGALDPSLVPVVLGHDVDTRTMLLADVPGEDQWNPPEAIRDAMVNKFVALAGELGRTQRRALVARSAGPAQRDLALLRAGASGA